MKRPEQRATDVMAGEQASAEGPSLDTLYRRYAVWLGRALRSRFGAVVADSAEDLVQETYIRIAPYRASGRIRQPRALLLRVASNLARDQMRHSARGGSATALIEEVDEKSETASPADQDETVLLKQIVLSLPQRLKEVFVLSRFAGLTNQDIADRCGLSVKTVEWRMTKALILLAKTLSD